MNSTRLTLITLLIIISFSYSAPQWKASKLNTRLTEEDSSVINQLTNDLQLIGNDFENSDAHISAKEALSQITASIKSVPQEIKESLRKLPHGFKEILSPKSFYSVFSKVKELRTSATNILSALTESTRSYSAVVKQRLEQFESEHSSTLGGIGSETRERWNKLKETASEKLQHIEARLADDVTHAEKNYEHIFDHFDHISANHHHPVITCNECGNTMTFSEFAKMVYNRGYLIKEENWWTDDDIEEFYGGWPVWANRSAVHCPKCDAVKWKSVEFVSDDEEKRLEDLEQASHAKSEL